MLTAHNQRDDVDAEVVLKADGSFFCPECQELVILKHGLVKQAHFAHQAASRCTFGAGESEVHRAAKRSIYTALQHHPLVSHVRLERPLGDVRPDVYARLANQYTVAIEVQLSTLSIEELARRTRSYAAKQIYVLWTPPYSEELVEGKRYAPLFWEKYLHALYFGRVYYWHSGESVLPVHFAPYELPYKQKYYDQQQDRWRAPTSSRFRRPQMLPALRITQLQGIRRSAWKASVFDLPAAHLWGLPRPGHQATAHQTHSS